MKIGAYLEKIQADESVFPVDQFATKNEPLNSGQALPADDPKKRKHKIGNIYSEQAAPHKKRILVDFDRTIHQYSRGWENGFPYDPPFEGTREALINLKEMGFEIVIFTSRLSEQNAIEHNQSIEQQKILLSEWFRKYQIPYDEMTADKIPAEFYIDDRAVCIIDGDWNEVLDKVKERMGSMEE